MSLLEEMLITSPRSDDMQNEQRSFGYRNFVIRLHPNG